MNAGDLNHVIRIDQQIENKDLSTGEVTHTWATYIDQLPASVAPASGREFLLASATQSQVQTKIGFWWLPGILPKMRVVDTGEGVTYNIDAVLPDDVNGRSWITLMCSSGINDG